jgi:hypothetical protein
MSISTLRISSNRYLNYDLCVYHLDGLHLHNAGNSLIACGHPWYNLEVGIGCCWARDLGSASSIVPDSGKLCDGEYQYARIQAFSIRYFFDKHNPICFKNPRPDRTPRSDKWPSKYSQPANTPHGTRVERKSERRANRKRIRVFRASVRCLVCTSARQETYN